ncbi:MAG TPA: diaminopimelate decarboxylase [Rhodocyclaceae bacterium]
MSFTLIDGELHAEQLPLSEIAARFGTPCYVYSRQALTSALQEFQSALEGTDSLVCYAVKANSNLAILNLFARQGAGFDIVSLGELTRVIAAGADPGKVIFSGVGKRSDEIEAAIMAGIGCFNVESEPELSRIDEIATRLGKKAPISLRVNPDVDPKTHPYISTGLRENKFGVDWQSARRIYQHAASLRGLEVVGIDCHIGSQILDVAPFLEALERILDLIDQLAADGIVLRHIDLGGGLGIRYRDETAPAIADYLGAVRDRLAGRKLKLLLEPGRRLVGNAGVLLTRVEYIKSGPEHNFAIVDAAMNDLLRPALYDAWHDIVPVRTRPGESRRYDVVGPVCESGDFLAKDRSLSIAAGDCLAAMSAGAYGMTMSSNYNTRPRAAEVMVDGSVAHLIRRRESIAELYAQETVLPA